MKSAEGSFSEGSAEGAALCRGVGCPHIFLSFAAYDGKATSR